MKRPEKRWPEVLFKALVRLFRLLKIKNDCNAEGLVHLQRHIFAVASVVGPIVPQAYWLLCHAETFLSHGGLVPAMDII